MTTEYSPSHDPQQAPTRPCPSLTGIILAGGLATRMGGVDKGLVIWEGQALVARIAARLAPQVASLLIVANRNHDTYATWGRVVADVIQGFEGPLAGLHAGLTSMSSDWALVVPVDAPLLPSTLAAALWPSIAEALPACVPVCAHDGHRPQPLFGLYHVSHASSMATSLARGERTLMRWHDQAGTRWVNVGTPDAFSNLNTPDELAGLLSPGRRG